MIIKNVCQKHRLSFKNISCQNVSLLFVAVINPYSVFKNFKYFSALVKFTEYGNTSVVPVKMILMPSRKETNVPSCGQIRKVMKSWYFFR